MPERLAERERGSRATLVQGMLQRARDEFAPEAGGLLHELALAAGEVVVDRAAGRAGGVDHLRERRCLDALPPHQQRGAHDHLVARLHRYDAMHTIAPSGYYDARHNLFRGAERCESLAFWP